MRSPPSSPDSHLSARRHHHARRQYVHHRRADEDWRAGGDGDGHRRFTHGGLPTYQKVNQWDVSLGGRIIRDRLWFHGTFRYADLINGISRTDEDLARLRAFRSDFEPFHNFSTSKQPFVKLTTQIGTHELSGFWQNDRHSFSSDRERNTHPISPRGTGGSLYQAKLNSVWGNHLQTSFQASYNNKGGADVDTYEDFAGFGPSIEVHESIRISSGLPMGTGRLVTMNNTETISIAPSSMLVFRGDLTVTLNATSSMPERKTGRGGGV
jgi:hypothetical protein